MTEIDKLAWLYLKDKKLLGARSHNRNIYYIPGGKREPGESDIETLIREIKEELSVDLIPSSIKYAETFKDQAHGKPKGQLVKITCYFADFTGTIKANTEVEEVLWLSHKDKSKCSEITGTIMDWLKTKGLLDA